MVQTWKPQPTPDGFERHRNGTYLSLQVLDSVLPSILAPLFFYADGLNGHGRFSLIWYTVTVYDTSTTNPNPNPKPASPNLDLNRNPSLTEPYQLIFWARRLRFVHSVRPLFSRKTKADRCRVNAIY